MQQSLLNHQIAARVDLKDVDLDCLDIIAAHGPFSPSALAQRLGLHPATVTGILDRLQRGGWVVRDRDPSDRRGVVVRALSDRNSELMQHYSGMNALLDLLCADFQEAELELVANFLNLTAGASRRATDDLGGATASSTKAIRST